MKKYILTLAAAALLPSISFSAPTTQLPNWNFNSFAEEPLAKSLTSGAEGSFTKSSTQDGERSISVLVYKRPLPKNWKKNKNLSSWKLLLSKFNDNNIKRTVIAEGVNQNPDTKDITYSFTMSYMPFEKALQQSYGKLIVKDSEAYLLIYDRNSLEFKAGLAEAKELIQSVKP